tara:strand:- start:369 stop:1277 length:909 start_codon:yes stop_codon:yes gene_type:complete
MRTIADSGKLNALMQPSRTPTANGYTPIAAALQAGHIMHSKALEADTAQAKASDAFAEFVHDFFMSDFERHSTIEKNTKGNADAKAWKASARFVLNEVKQTWLESQGFADLVGEQRTEKLKGFKVSHNWKCGISDYSQLVVRDLVERYLVLIESKKDKRTKSSIVRDLLEESRAKDRAAKSQEKALQEVVETDEILADIETLRSEGFSDEAIQNDMSILDGHVITPFWGKMIRAMQALSATEKESIAQEILEHGVRVDQVENTKAKGKTPAKRSSLSKFTPDTKVTELRIRELVRAIETTNA